MNAGGLVLRPVNDEAGIIELFPLMAQLRPHLASAAEFLDRWQRQVAHGYRLVALFDGARPQALAGFRLQENLVYGRFLYVDDLVTDAARRSAGCGERLMTYLRHEAQAQHCARLVLDTPLSNALGHRFYFRCGLLATALRFNLPMEP